MSLQIGRLGTLGLAIESTPGTPVGSPTVFIPFTENKIKVMHKPIMDTAAHGSRVDQYGAVKGEQWGEGDVTMYLDSINAGYFAKLATGGEALTQDNANPAIYDHLMVPTVSGNTPLTATLWDYKGVDTQQFAYSVFDTIEVDFKNSGIATIKAKVISQLPTTVTLQNRTTTSGTLYTWANATVQLGATVPLAQIAAATKVTAFKFTYNNAAKANYKSGSNSPDTIDLGSLKATGEFTIFFENTTQRDNFKNLVGQTLLVTFNGASLGAGYTEQLLILFKKVILTSIDYESGLDAFFGLKCNFEAIYDQVQAGWVDITFRNGKTTAY